MIAAFDCSFIRLGGACVTWIAVVWVVALVLFLLGVVILAAVKGRDR